MLFADLISHKRVAALLPVLVCLLASGLYAQSYQGGIRGEVSDGAGAKMAGSKVTVINEATAQTLSVMSTSTGEFIFSKLDPATYTLIAESPGFKKYERKGIVVATQSFITSDVRLEVGDVSTTVNVTEEVPVIETANASTGQILDRQKLVDLPNLGRNPFVLSRIAQNVTPVGNPGYNRMQDQSGSSSISIAGGPVRGNNYLVDGVPITDSVNRAVIIPTIESVGEVKIQANTYDAESGRTGGGVFNTFMKSGTNQFHGSLFGYLRETSWLANTFFNNSAGIPRGDQPTKNWGSSFGGYISIPKLYDGRNRTFFYLGEEAYRQVSSYGAQFSVPTSAEIAGDFSKSLIKTSAGSSVLPIYDPATGALNSSGAWIRTQFPGNIIPANRLNVVGSNIARTYPAPNGVASQYGAVNYSASASLRDYAHQFTAKLDQTFTSWWRASISYLWYKSLEPGENNFGTVSSPNQWTLGRKVNATAINNIITINPTTVLSIRYGFNRFPNENSVRSLGFNVASLGFSSNYTKNIAQQMFPVINLSTLQSLGTNNRDYSVFHSNNFLVGVSKFLGRHSIKAGFDYRKIAVDGISYGQSSGAFGFSDVYTRQNPALAGGGANGGADLASLLLGLPISRQIDYGTNLGQYVNYYAGYVHDDFRFSNKLTLNLGIRFESETGITGRNNALIVGFDPNASYPVVPGGPTVKGGLEYAGTNGYGTSTFNPTRVKVSPRIGIAYQLTGKTILRGGYGLFWAPVPFGLQNPLGYTQDNITDVSFDNFRTASVSLTDPYPNGVNRPVGNAKGLQAGVGSSVSFLDQNSKSPYVHQYSFDVQHQFGYGIGMALGYVGSQAGNLSLGMGNVNINQLDPKYLSLGSDLNTRQPNPFYVAGATGLVGQATLPKSQLLRPFPQFNSVTAILQSRNRSLYHSMVLKAQKRLSNGFSLSSTWTWSINKDNSSGGVGNFFNGLGGYQNGAYDVASEYSLSGFHTPHRWTNAVTYELPFGKGKQFMSNSRIADYAIGGWSINFVNVFQTGFPLAVTQNNQNGVIGATAQRPNATGTSPAYTGNDRLFYLDASGFSLAPQFTFGNVSRTITNYGPGQQNWDVSVFKTVTIYERFKGQFRAEALNAFNTPLFRAPNTNFVPGSTANFGKVTSQANFPRFIQLGLRFYF